MLFINHLFRIGKGRPGRPRGVDRRRRFAVESLEGRQLMAFNFASAFGVGGTSVVVAKTALDAQGDTFVTGNFTGKVDFDPNGGGTNVLNSGTMQAAFVAEYSPSNTLLWVKEFTPDAATPGSSASGTGLAIDPNNGSIYVVGNFAGKVDFDPGPNTVNLTSAGGTDGYVVKLTPNGGLDSNLVKRFGGAGFDTANAVDLSPNGQTIAITGSYINTANFDPGGTNTSLTSPVANQTDSYVLDLSSGLGFNFASRAALAGSIGFAVGADSQGNVYITGTQPSGAGSNAFLSKFNSLGTLVTERTFGGIISGGTQAQGRGLVIDTAGNVYVDGFFSGTGVNFNKFNTPGTAALDSAGASDAFLVKVDPSFDLVWARRFGSKGSDFAFDLAIDGSNNVYFTGSEQGQSSFGTTGLGMMVLDTGNGMTGTSNGYVLEVDSSGNFVQATGAGGTGLSVPDTVAVNGMGEVAIAGVYTAPATFGGTTLASLGTSQFFVATLGGGGGGGGGGTGGSGGGGGGGGGTVAVPPSFVNVIPITTGKGKHKKIVGYELVFSSALNAANDQNVGHYQVTQPGKKGKTTVVPVLAAAYNPAANGVTLTLGAHNQKKALQLTAMGLTGATGAAVPTIVTLL